MRNGSLRFLTASLLLGAVNNRHRSNENPPLGHVFNSIVTFAAILTMDDAN